VRAALATRFAGCSKIRVLAPEEAERLPAHSLDLVVLHSVAQYLTAPQADALFALFHRLLGPTGILVVSDVIAPHVPGATDAAALIRFAAANGFLLAALIGIARTLMSDYMRLRSRLGLTRYDEATMLRKLAAAGFAGERAAKNIGHNPARMTFIARPR
jgi:SAM-dependent methyltransferase